MSGQERVKKKIVRCAVCNKRLFRPRTCSRCGKTFCSKHINARAHGCLPPSAASRYFTPKVAAALATIIMVVVAFYLYGLLRPQPAHVHLSWQNDPKTTMTVMWWSSKPGNGKVEYGGTLLRHSVTAPGESYEGGYLYIAEITGLEPGKKYRYKCGVKGEWSRAKKFQTAPPDDASASFTFSFLCDSRSQPEPRRNVVNMLRNKGADLIIDAGDLVSSGHEQDQWDEWFDDMEDIISNIPFMCVVGNHEKNSKLYYDQFAFPGQELYYSFDYGNTHFVGLNSEIAVNGTQAEWLESDLEKARGNPDIVWIIAYFHQPVFTASSHEGRIDIAEKWGPTMDKYHVDIVFCGHNHCYERTSALLSNGTITNRGQHLVDPSGTVHITSGGAGAPLYETDDVRFIEQGRSLYHFVRVRVDGKRLELNAIRDTGSTFDTLVIEK